MSFWTAVTSPAAGSSLPGRGPKVAPLTVGRDESNNLLALLQPLVAPGFIKAKVARIPNADQG